MKTIKLELSVKILMGAIALGLFLNVFKDFPPKAYASQSDISYCWDGATINRVSDSKWKIRTYC